MPDDVLNDRPRIIVIDDNEAIHDDFRKILVPRGDSAELDEDEAFLFGKDTQQSSNDISFELESACQGRDGLTMVQAAVEAGRPYALAFVDMRMPPGWDGVETIKHLWKADPRLQIVICTAYSDYTWRETIDQLGQSDQLLILKKPFDVAEVSQLAAALTRKWSIQGQLVNRMEQLENAVAERTQSLDAAVTELRGSQQLVQSTLNSLSARIAILDTSGCIAHVNSRWAESDDGNPVAGGTLTSGSDYLSACEAAAGTIPFAGELAGHVRDVMNGAKDESTGEYVHASDESDSRCFTVRLTRFSASDSIHVVVSHEDMTDVRGLQDQLAQAQKLESVGQLAAGVAHEINTPIQYIGDNTRFLQSSFSDLTGLLTETSELLAAAQSGVIDPALVARVEKAIADADVEFLLEEVPSAVVQSLEGIDRVSTIVRAMKEFSHPGEKDKSNVNLNDAIQSTLTVARHEWKYVADMELSLDPDLPLVQCLPGEINQVLLNILVNASHAIADTLGEGSGDKGKIRISTQCVDDSVEIRISDSGTGIPEHVQARIFDPFFTTKGVGKGTGQGLALAWAVITEKHAGSLSFETAPGNGTTFIVRLPLTDTPAGELDHDTSHTVCG